MKPVRTNFDPPWTRQYAPDTGRLDPMICLYQESDEQLPQHIDPRFLELNNGQDLSNMSYSDGHYIDQLCNGVERTQLAQLAAIDTAQNQPEDANHAMDNHAESGVDSLAKTGADNNGDNGADNLLAEVAKTPDMDGRSQQTTSDLLDKVIIETKDNECLIVRKETLKSCSSRFLRRSVRNMNPNDTIVYMTRDSLGAVKFYLSWLEGGSAARNDNFLRPKSDGSPGFMPQFETLFDFYMAGFRLVDAEFMDWVVDKWIDLLDQGYYPSDMAKRIYDARPLDLPLKRLYVATWAILSDETWLTDTVDGQNAPTEFFHDVCKTKKRFTERLKHILKPGQLWMPWRARWAYYSNPKSKMNNVAMQGTSSNTSGAHNGQTQEATNNVTVQETSNDAPGDANNRKRTAADEEEEEIECANAVAKWKAQYAKRWTSPELQKKYGF